MQAIIQQKRKSYEKQSRSNRRINIKVKLPKPHIQNKKMLPTALQPAGECIAARCLFHPSCNRTFSANPSIQFVDCLLICTSTVDNAFYVLHDHCHLYTYLV